MYGTCFVFNAVVISIMIWKSNSIKKQFLCESVHNKYLHTALWFLALALSFHISISHVSIPFFLLNVFSFQNYHLYTKYQQQLHQLILIRYAPTKCCKMTYEYRQFMQLYEISKCNTFISITMQRNDYAGRPENNFLECYRNVPHFGRKLRSRFRLSRLPCLRLGSVSLLSGPTPPLSTVHLQVKNELVVWVNVTLFRFLWAVQTNSTSVFYFQSTPFSSSVRCYCVTWSDH